MGDWVGTGKGTGKSIFGRSYPLAIYPLVSPQTDRECLSGMTACKPNMSARVLQLQQPKVPLLMSLLLSRAHPRQSQPPKWKLRPSNLQLLYRLTQNCPLQAEHQKRGGTPEKGRCFTKIWFPPKKIRTFGLKFWLPAGHGSRSENCSVAWPRSLVQFQSWVAPRISLNSKSCSENGLFTLSLRASSLFEFGVFPKCHYMYEAMCFSAN